MLGFPFVYIPYFSTNYQVNFDEKTNTLNVETPITKIVEYIKYIVLVGKDGVISKKDFPYGLYVSL